MLEPLPDEADDFFVREHLPEAVGGEDDKIALGRVNGGRGHNGFGSDIGRCFEEVMGSAAEPVLLDAVLGFSRPFVEGVAKGACGFELSEDTAGSNDIVLSWVFGSHSSFFVRVGAGLIFGQRCGGPFPGLGVASAEYCAAVTGTCDAKCFIVGVVEGEEST